MPPSAPISPAHFQALRARSRTSMRTLSGTGVRRCRASALSQVLSSKCRSMAGVMKRVRAAKIVGKTTTIDDLVNGGVVMVGSPNTVREKLAEYQDLAGFNTSLTKTQFGTMGDAQARANMAAIAEEVLPHFRDRLPEPAKRQAAE